MNRYRYHLATLAAGAAAATGLALTLAPGAASATDFLARGGCDGVAILHQTKGVADTLHTWTYTVNGRYVGTNVTLEGIAVGGHPATITVEGRYWRAAGADTSTREDTSTTITRSVDYPSDCAPPPPPTTAPATTVPPPDTSVFVCTDGSVDCQATTTTAPPVRTLPPTL